MDSNIGTSRPTNTFVPSCLPHLPTHSFLHAQSQTGTSAQHESAAESTKEGSDEACCVPASVGMEQDERLVEPRRMAAIIPGVVVHVAAPSAKGRCVSRDAHVSVRGVSECCGSR